MLLVSIIMRPSSVGGGRILRCTLSVRLSVCPSVPCLFTLEHRSRVFVNLADVWYLLFCLHVRAAYLTAISAAQACFYCYWCSIGELCTSSADHDTRKSMNIFSNRLMGRRQLAHLIIRKLIQVEWKQNRSERRKHCALAVVRRSQKFSPRHRPPSRGRRTAKI